MQDEVINPLETETDAVDYFQISSTKSTFEEGNYSHVFELDNQVQMQSRTRYSFWQALGDIGGFHDGLLLLLRYLVAPIAATLFQNDLLSTKRKEMEQSIQKQRRRS